MPGTGATIDPIGPRVDVGDIVGQAVAVQVVERDGRAHRRDPGRDLLKAGMDRSDRAGRASRQFRQGVTCELEPPRQPGRPVYDNSGLPGHRVERDDNPQGNQPWQRGGERSGPHSS